MDLYNEMIDKILGTNHVIFAEATDRLLKITFYANKKQPRL